MKRIFFILSFLIILSTISAQNRSQSNHAFKAKIVGGAFIPMGLYKTHLGINSPSIVGGFEFDYELLPKGEYSWEKHWNYPSIGFSTLALKLDCLGGAEADTTLGYMVAAYPYVNIPFIRTNIGEFGAKVGMGVAFFNKKAPGLGSYVACNIGIGLNGKINLTDRCALTIDATYNPITNGNIYGTNATMNIFYGAVGAYVRLGDSNYRLPRARRAENLQYKFMINTTASMSFKYLEDRFTNGKYNDKYKSAMQATAHIDYLHKITNCWATGGAIDAIITSNGLRLGLAYANGFTMGRFTGLIDAGMNLFEQKNENGKNKLSSFEFNEFKFLAAKGSDRKKYQSATGTLYLRAGLRYRLIDNIYIQISGRTFVHSFDCAEFGIGYSIPYTVKRRTYTRTKIR